MDDIDTEVIELIAEQLNKETSEINRDDDIVDDLGADSLDVVELMIAIEEKFRISLPDHLMEQSSTVKQIIETVTEYAG